MDLGYKHKGVVALGAVILFISIFLTGCSTANDNIVEYCIPQGAIELQNSVAEVYNNASSIVTIISDDGVYSTAVNLNAIFGVRNMRCTVAGVVTIVEPKQKYWESILEDGVVELVSHSYSHKAMDEEYDIANDIEELKHQIIDADAYYEEFIGCEQIAFVCPENRMCTNGYEILASNNFWAVRRGNRGYNSLSPDEGTEPGQWFNLKVWGICDDGVDIDVRNGWVDTAIDEKLWLIEMWHNVMPSDDECYQTLLWKDACEHLDYIVTKRDDNEIWVATYNEAVKYIREKQNSKVYSYITDEKLHVYIELTNVDMKYATFNQELTVNIDIPEGIKLVESDDVELLDGVLTVNIVPGEEKIIDLVGE